MLYCMILLSLVVNVVININLVRLLMVLHRVRIRINHLVHMGSIIQHPPRRISSRNFPE